MTPYDKKSSFPRVTSAGMIVWYGRLPPWWNMLASEMTASVSPDEPLKRLRALL